MGILGNIEELGFWKKDHVNYFLKEIEKGVWASEEPFICEMYFFTYKYVIIDKNYKSNKILIDYERGVDRICDAEILPEIQ